MAKHTNGSSLLMVICFTGAVSLMVLGVWRNTMYTLEAALARMAYAQSLKSTEGLLNVAIEVGIENYEKLMKSTQETSIEMPAWFTGHGKAHTGIISLSAQKEHLMARATLKNTDTMRCALRCHITKEPEGGHRIWDWAIDTQS